MLFNSFSFLFLFLPIVALGFFGLARRSKTLAAAWLAGASLVFYGWWSVAYIPLLLASILFNYGAGWQMGRTAAPGARKRLLIVAVAADLALLAYFKYADFLIGSVNTLTGAELDALNVILPIGISFYTFTQIAFLVDTYQGKVSETRFVHYLLFVTYFPHLIAGPVLHHKEMMPQFDQDATYRPSRANLAIGLAIFAIGLAKKVLIADNLAPHAGFFFDASDQPSLLLAWGGVLAYSFQLYFDFSGYSDMAIGLSRLFGIRLPLNFHSPYKAVNITEFWRRWHMTLSRFLRDYLYIALGGNRHGAARRYFNLMATMVLGGLWHGAGWNFVVWGCLHGAYLMLNHAWAALAARLRISTAGRTWNAAGMLLTFGAVCVAWVFFRSADFERALTILRGLFGAYGIGLPDSIGNRLGGLRSSLEQLGISFYLGGGTRFLQTWSWVVVGAAIAFLLPNTQQIMGRYEPALDYQLQRDGGAGALAWRPSRRWAAVIGVLCLASLLSLSRPAEFLYFQF
ncbi:MAG TPA: MBOAT family protein [Telluria sp.]|jgi:D-alanyl-lipoteichoic acid acyltransferase DltB (MBOAT superfamily)